MKALSDERCILGVDPNSRGLAFVSFENGQLLDWGTRRRDGDELAVLDELLDRSAADVLVLEDWDAPRCERRARMRRLLRTLADRARARGVSVVPVSRYEVRLAWKNLGVTTKHGVALQIAGRFSELEPVLPRPRKRYQPEQARMDIFDAASLVTHAVGTEASD